MLYKRAFIYIHCFGPYEYSCPYSFETLNLFNLKGQRFRWEKLMQGKWVNYSFKNKYCFGTPFYTCVFNKDVNQHLVEQCIVEWALTAVKTLQVLNAFVCFSPYWKRTISIGKMHIRELRTRIILASALAQWGFLELHNIFLHSPRLQPIRGMVAWNLVLSPVCSCKWGL